MRSRVVPVTRPNPFGGRPEDSGSRSWACIPGGSVRRGGAGAAEGEPMKLVRARAVALRQYYLVRGSPVRVLPLVGWVILDITLWGFISRYLGTFSAAGLSFVPKLLGAVVLWDFLMRAMQGFTVAFLA